MLSIANSSQFGNNAFIAPKAKIDDGLIDFCFLKKFPLWKAPIIAYLIFNKKIFLSKYWEKFKKSQAIILQKGKTKTHIDGEAIFFDGNINIKVQKKSLNVLTPVK